MLKTVRALNAALETNIPKTKYALHPPQGGRARNKQKHQTSPGVFVLRSQRDAATLKAMDIATKHAIQHTLHCLTGCGIGEVLGSAIGAQANWPNVFQTLLATVLAFAFGYGLTYRGARKMGQSSREAMRAALTTDTISIISMEIIDNTLEWLIPGAINAGVVTWLFWWSMAVSLAVAFLFTVPVNRFVMTRSNSDTHHHMH